MTPTGSESCEDSVKGREPPGPYYGPTAAWGGEDRRFYAVPNGLRCLLGRIWAMLCNDEVPDSTQKPIAIAEVIAGKYQRKEREQNPCLAGCYQHGHCDVTPTVDPDET